MWLVPAYGTYSASGNCHSVYVLDNLDLDDYDNDDYDDNLDLDDNDNDDLDDNLDLDDNDNGDVYDDNHNDNGDVYDDNFNDNGDDDNLSKPPACLLCSNICLTRPPLPLMFGNMIMIMMMTS